MTTAPENQTASSLESLAERVDRLEGFERVVRACSAAGGHSQVDGLTGVAKSLFLARLIERTGQPVLVVTYQLEQARRLADDLAQFGVPDSRICILPPTEGAWLADAVTDHFAVGERIAALTALASGEPSIVIGTAEAVLQRTSPPSEILPFSVTLETGSSADLEHLGRSLVELGYEAEDTVSRPGQFSRRGGILDIFPSTADAPVRVELFGDDIESIRTFDPNTQRSVAALDQVLIAPAREIRLTTESVNRAVEKITTLSQRRKMELAKEGKREAFGRLTEVLEDDLTRMQNGVYFEGAEEYLPFLVVDEVCALDYLQEAGGRGQEAGGPPLVVIDEPGQVLAHSERLRSDIADARERRFDRGELLQGGDHSIVVSGGTERIAREFNTLSFSQLPRNYSEFPARERLSVSTAPMESYRAQVARFAEEVKRWTENGAECLVVTDQPKRVGEICGELGLAVWTGEEEKGRRGEGESADSVIAPLDHRPSTINHQPITILHGRLRQGFKFADIGLYVATDAELFGSSRPVLSSRKAKGGIPISTILDLRENDFVVHVAHGIGVYRGLVQREVEGAARDYLAIQYAGGDRLYVPADQIDRIQRYIGGEGAPPTVSRIGGNEWQRTTKRVKEQARQMAAELIQLYAAREASRRPSHGDDSPWQIEMEEAFPYEETPSQLRAIRDVKGDMENDRPMDRLVCGDVGFGKTEVAIRAAFKALDSGRQVAVLCPTTILAAQHHTTFSERLAAYPITIELLSRFRSRQELAKTIQGLKLGTVDIVVGTHRLLSRDVEFNNLGLIIVDEEQRFGVAHKERLKQLRTSVDVLTLTATPIPRTLSMALSGLRDMSVIEDPPTGRMPIVTRVSEYDDDVVRDAILRELERDGQVYFVHNRIESIDYIAQRIQRLVPDARIRIGHGQMSEDELEKIMYEFYHQSYDVLVCTTIIENGLDIPNVNTIIVDRADRMGLAQLYQLRGRVGRSNRQAYAYLLYRPAKQLTQQAEDRLMAIREFTALGSGFQIAMKDLEIRGAGNLLGAEQSGAIVQVGYDLYCQLLAEAVGEMRGEEQRDETLPPIDLPITAHIPNDYVPSEAERIYLYKKMSAVRSVEDISGLQEEVEDRYGDPPRTVWNALAVLRLRLKAKEAGIASVRGERRDVTIRLAPHARLSPDAIKLLTYAFKNHRFTADSVVVPLSSPKILEEVEEMVKVLERALQHGKPAPEGAAAR